MFDHIKLSDIPEKQCRVLRKASGTRPVIHVIEENGKRAVVKDFSTNGFLFRHIVGRFLVWREKRASARLTGVEGVPVLYGTIDGIALVMEEVSGQRLKAAHRSTGIPRGFYEDLHSLLSTIHGRGLAHCDLKRDPNIIITGDNRPYIVDWSASISSRECRFFPLSLVFKRFLRDDMNAITKLKLKYSPELVTREERDLYINRGLFERLIRRIRDGARRLLKRIV
jgi:RIO-like serine/threonine protein kinase